MLGASLARLKVHLRAKNGCLLLDGGGFGSVAS